MKDAPAFDFYPERFWFAVEGWTEQEVCRYWRLLGQQWMRDGLPANEMMLARLARGKLTERILEKFPIGPDGQRRNPFMEDLRVKQRDRISRRRFGAEKTNAQRWNKSRSANRSATTKRQKKKGDSDSPPPTSHLPPQDSAAASAADDVPVSEHQRFIDRWTEAFNSSHSFPYKFQGGKDGSAVKGLLATGMGADKLLEIARKAWGAGSFWADRAVTIAGFSSAFNDICSEVLPKGGRKTSRTNGVPHIGPAPEIPKVAPSEQVTPDDFKAAKSQI